MTNPRVGAYVVIPDDCPVTCTLTGDHDIEVRFGALVGGFELVCERAVLARLVDIAGRALTLPLPNDAMTALPTLTSTATG